MNEVRKRHNKRKIITEQHFCSKCGDRLESKYSPCEQCESDRRIHVKEKNKSVLPQSSFSFSGNRLLPLVVVGFILGSVTFFIIGMASAPDPYDCTQCDPFSPGYDGPPPIEMDILIPDDYYYDNYYYDDYYYDDYYGD